MLSSPAIEPMASLPKKRLLPIKRILNTEKVIAIAGGRNKANAIFGALNTGAINILITDHTAANYILEMIK